MSQTHLHLIVTHLPVFGSILGVLVLGYGLWVKSNQTKSAAYFLFIISAIGASISYLTGEGAEDTVEKLQGVSKTMIERHEDSAIYVLISFIVLGVISMTALVANRYKPSLIRPTSIIILVLSLLSFGLATRTGYLGGRIRHTEISTGAVQNNTGGEGKQTDD
ncbi:hypothetical protein A3860_37735 [Niastella vici]|uniref:DUF2231 domain-containing protein n=1 Tax=Niastella vici TaxID=1703345 RepID=A0A1V9FM38_9BACT|nr:hypothetical protein [Niastella vici]OQP59402.1 hypothetical protein A3860_37735 [Niastella vici]